jgi:hypothetical protein
VSRENPWEDEPGVIPCLSPHRSIGAYTTGRTKVALHCSAYDPGGVLAFERHQGLDADYHVAYDPMRDELLAPFYSLTESARALRKTTVVETNRARTIQPVLLGTPAQLQALSVPRLERIGRRLVAPIMRAYPEIRWRVETVWYDSPNGCGGRLSLAEWAGCDFFTSHARVLRQEPTCHWDPCLSPAAIDTILTAAEREVATVGARFILPMPPTLTAGSGGSPRVDVASPGVDRVDADTVTVTFTSQASIVGGSTGTVVPGRGYLEVEPNGGVHARDGAPYLGNAYPMPTGEVLVGGLLALDSLGRLGLWLATSRGGVYVPTNGDVVNHARFLGSMFTPARPAGYPTEAIAPIPGGYRLIHSLSSWTDFREA